MPVPILIFGAFTIMAFVFAPPSILITGAIWLLILNGRHKRKVEDRAARKAKAARDRLDRQMAAARAIGRMGN